MDTGNPFAALVESDSVVSNTANVGNLKEISTSHILEDVFGFTLIEEDARERGLVFLKDLAEVFTKRQLDTEILEHALFERLLLEGDDKVDEVLIYLFDCYCKLDALGEEGKSIKPIVMRDIVTSLKQPDLYTTQDINQQFFNLTMSDFSSKLRFFEDLYTALANDEGA